MQKLLVLHTGCSRWCHISVEKLQSSLVRRYSFEHTQDGFQFVGKSRHFTWSHHEGAVTLLAICSYIQGFLPPSACNVFMFALHWGFPVYNACFREVVQRKCSIMWIWWHCWLCQTEPGKHMQIRVAASAILNSLSNCEYLLWCLLGCSLSSDDSRTDA